MEIKEGAFLFVKQSFFDSFPNGNFSINKVLPDGTVHKRPCFFVFCDAKTGLLWCVPISSRTDKYREIMEQKIRKNGRCDTIIIGKIFNRESAFLIQNMFPVTEQYLDGVYLDRYHHPVVADSVSAKSVSSSARRVLALARQGKVLTFTDILSIEKYLLTQTTNHPR